MNNEPRRPQGEWGSTGANVPALEGGYFLPSGSNGDPHRRNMLARIIAGLYSAVGSAQKAPLTDNESEHATHQLVVANGALVASEADALLTLASIGLDAPTQIHLRSISELTARILLCKENPDLALELYKAHPASWTRLAAKLELFDVTAFDKAELDMRSLESTPRFKDARAAVIAKYHLLDDTQASVFSKRSHGDIYALVEVSNNLRARDGDVRRAINKVLPAGVATNILIDRATTIGLAALLAIAEEFGMDGEHQIKDIFEAYRDLQKHDKETKALHIPGFSNESG